MGLCAAKGTTFASVRQTERHSTMSFRQASGDGDARSQQRGVFPLRSLAAFGPRFWDISRGALEILVKGWASEPRPGRSCCWASDTSESRIISHPYLENHAELNLQWDHVVANGQKARGNRRSQRKQRDLSGTMVNARVSILSRVVIC